MGSHTFAPLVTNICYWDQGQDAFCNYDNEFVSAKNSPTNTPYYYPIKTAITHYSPSSRGINEGRPKSGGSKLLRDIAGLNGDISMAGMTPEQKSVVKKNRLRLMVTGQFSDGATFEAEECRGNNSLLAFDLDNTDITNRQILKVFKAAETLIHTTPRHNPDADLRRIRVIVLCSRTMTIDEHGLLMKHYQSVFHKLSPNNHGVDPSKLTPWSKFYLPHRESTKYHNHKDKRPLDVDEILSKFPRPPIVLVPSLADIEYTYPAGINPQASSNCTLMTKCLNVVSQLRDGNRHIPSVKVGGMAKPLSIEQKHEIANQLQMMGASKEDLKGYWRYANQRR